MALGNYRKAEAVRPRGREMQRDASGQGTGCELLTVKLQRPVLLLPLKVYIWGTWITLQV